MLSPCLLWYTLEWTEDLGCDIVTLDADHWGAYPSSDDRNKIETLKGDCLMCPELGATLWNFPRIKLF